MERERSAPAWCFVLFIALFVAGIVCGVMTTPPEVVEVFVDREVIVEKDRPVVKLVEVEKVVEKIVEKPIDRIITKTIEKTVDKIVYVDRPVDRPVEKIVEVEKIIYVERASCRRR